jgi:PAS domain S-box-containing protein
MSERGTRDGHGVIQGVTTASLPDHALGSLRELDALFDQTPVALLFADRDLRARRTNAAFRRLTGVPDEAIIGRRPSEVDGVMDAALIERILGDQVMTTGVPVFDVPLEQTLAGERRVYSWSANRVTDNGQVLGALCRFGDVTDFIQGVTTASLPNDLVHDRNSAT